MSVIQISKMHEAVFGLSSMVIIISFVFSLIGNTILKKISNNSEKKALLQKMSKYLLITLISIILIIVLYKIFFGFSFIYIRL